MNEQVKTFWQEIASNSSNVVIKELPLVSRSWKSRRLMNRWITFWRRTTFYLLCQRETVYYSCLIKIRETRWTVRNLYEYKDSILTDEWIVSLRGILMKIQTKRRFRFWDYNHFLNVRNVHVGIDCLTFFFFHLL